MSGLEPEPQGVDSAGEARAAAQALAEAAEHVKSLTGTESPVLLIGLQRRITDATVALEELGDRRLSAAMIREAHRQRDYEAGWEACSAARRGLRSAS